MHPRPFLFQPSLGLLMIMAYHPGDKEYAYTEQPVGIPYPKNEVGAAQTIDFPQIADQKMGAKPFTLESHCLIWTAG